MKFAKLLPVLLIALTVLAACSDVVDGKPNAAGTPRSATSTAPTSSTPTSPAPTSSAPTSPAPTSSASTSPAPTKPARTAVAGRLPDFTKGVVVGSGPVTVTAYDDLACPPCARLEVGFAKLITKQLATKKVGFRFFDLSFLDSVSKGRKYSSRAANAALCAAQIGPPRYLAFKRAILASQPPEGTTGLTNAQILTVAKGAGITSPDYTRCVTGARFAAQVRAIGKAGPKNGVMSVPAIFVQNKPVKNPSLVAITKAINAAK